MENSLDLAARNARNEYARKWRAKNKEKVKRNNENYWRRVAARQLAEKNEVEK